MTCTGFTVAERFAAMRDRGMDLDRIRCVAVARGDTALEMAVLEIQRNSNQAAKQEEIMGKSSQDPVPLGTVVELPIKDIIPTKDCPRRIDEHSAKYKELLESIQAAGVQVPVIVRPHPTNAGKYDLRAGKRRLHASKAAGRKTIPAIVRDLSDQAAWDLTYAENRGREDLTALEECEIVRIGMERYGDVKTLAAQLGWSENKVRICAQAASLSDRWVFEIEGTDPEDAMSTWSAMHFGVIAKYDKEVQDAALDAMDRNGMTYRRAAELSVSQLDQFMRREFERSLSSCKWDLDDACLLAKAGPCTTCQNRSSAQPDLFAPWPVDNGTAEVPADDRCLDAECWDAKTSAWIEIRQQELKKKNADCVTISTENYPRKLRKGVLGRFDYEVCKKSEPGALKALVVDGPGLGNEKWVKPTERYTRPAVSSSRSTSGSNAKKKKTLVELREELQARRDVVLADKLSEKMLVDRSVPVPDAEVILRLVILFGAVDADEIGFEDILNMHEIDLRKKALSCIHDIRPYHLVDFSIRDLCSMAGWDEIYQEIARAAEEAIPEPAEWADMEEK